jgi:hypothetical protein
MRDIPKRKRTQQQEMQHTKQYLPHTAMKSVDWNETKGKLVKSFKQKACRAIPSAVAVRPYKIDAVNSNINIKQYGLCLLTYERNVLKEHEQVHDDDHLQMIDRVKRVS